MEQSPPSEHHHHRCPLLYGGFTKSGSCLRPRAGGGEGEGRVEAAGLTDTAGSPRLDKARPSLLAS